MLTRRLTALLLALLGLAAPLAAQDGKKLTDSSVPACPSAEDEDFFWSIQGGTSYRCTIGAIRSAVTSFASDPANCSAGQYPLGIAADGSAQSCTAVPDLATAAPYGQYDPMKPPAAPHGCTDEFTNGFEETWTGQNVGTSTFTASLDGASFVDATGAGANDRPTYWNQCGSKPTDSFTVITKGTMYAAGSGSAASIALLESGSEATPSKIILCEVTEVSGIFKVRFATVTSYTGSASTVSGTLLNLRGSSPGLVEFWLRAEYDDGADTVKCAASLDGINWAQSQNAYTLTTDPLGLGLHGNSLNAIDNRFEFFRVRTDANRLQASDD